MNMNSWRTRWGEVGERGQTLVMVGIMMFVLLGVGAMALDVGVVLWSRGTQQNAADSAAMAGVGVLPGDPAAAVLLANGYADANGFDDADPAVEVIPIATTVTLPDGTDLPALDVTINNTLPAGLRAAVGGGDIVVPARAIAVVTKVVNKCNVLPMAIENSVQPYDADGNPVGSPVPYWETYGYLVKLKMSPGDAYSGGNFGTLALNPDGGGADRYREYLERGGSCLDSDDQPTETGAMSGPTTQGFEFIVEKAVGTSADWPALCASPGVECTNGVPDNVHWNTRDEPRAVADPAEQLRPWGLGSPNPGVNSGCSGPPSLPGNPYPTVVAGTCPRVLTVPVVNVGSWPNGSSMIHIDDWAAFYVLGTEGNGTNMVVVGSFINYAQAPMGTPTWEDPTDASQVGFFLWQ